MSNRTRQNNKRADRKMESNDNPEIPDRVETSEEPGLPPGQRKTRRTNLSNVFKGQWKASRTSLSNVFKTKIKVKVIETSMGEYLCHA